MGRSEGKGRNIMDFVYFVVIPNLIIGLCAITVKCIVGDSPNVSQGSSNDFYAIYLRDRNPATRL